MDRGVQVLGFDFWNGSSFSVNSFISSTGVTYPMLMNASFLSLSGSYGISYDNYVVVDPQGIVRYTSLHGGAPGPGSWNDAAVRNTIEQWLPTPVEEQSWSGVKALFRD